jgi:hypothetical protein
MKKLCILYIDCCSTFTQLFGMDLMRTAWYITPHTAKIADRRGCT